MNKNGGLKRTQGMALHISATSTLVLICGIVACLWSASCATCTVKPGGPEQRKPLALTSQRDLHATLTHQPNDAKKARSAASAN